VRFFLFYYLRGNARGLSEAVSTFAAKLPF